MPILDMPLEELEKYSGINSRPDDFDFYWDKTIAEADGCELITRWVDADFSAPGVRCFHLFFKGADGADIHAKALIPEMNEAGAAQTAGPAVLHFHGYSSSSGPWIDYLAYAATGTAVFAMDCRGQGGPSEDLGGHGGNTIHGQFIRGLDGGDPTLGRPENLLFRRIFQDTAILARIVGTHPAVDPQRIGVFGGSQGGALTIACAALTPSIKMAAPCYPFLSDYRRVWEMDLAKGAYQELRDWFRKFDPLHEREEAVFTRLGYIDIQHLSSRIRGEVLFGCSLMDEICPPSTQFAVYNKITSPKSMTLYKDFGHEDLPGFSDRTYQFFQRL